MAVYLEEYIDSIENLPAEIKHHLSEIRVRNEQHAALKKAIIDGQKQHMKEGSDVTRNRVDEKYEEVKNLCDEKIGIAEKSIEMLNRHIKRLDDQIVAATKSIEEKGLNLYDSFAGLDEISRPAVSRRKKTVGDKGFNMSMLSGADGDMMDESYDEDGGEPVYCVCQQESYGEMIACDNAESCPFEWFHYGCVGLTAPPQGAWFCPVCAPKFKKKKF